MASYNIEGIANNPGRLSNILPNTILAVQEHWLFEYEKCKTKDICPTHDFHIRCVDTDDPIHPSHRPRGYGGAAILWPKSLSAAVTILPDGNQRIVAISISCIEGKDAVIISAYLPCRGGRGSEEEFTENLDILHEILVKYRTTHIVIICGDLNTNLIQPRHRRDSLACDFVKDNHLYISGRSTKPTFFHHNDVSTNVLDYIITTDPNTVSNYLTHNPDFRCTSSHVPVSARLELHLNEHAKPTSKKKKTLKHIVWDRCDVAAYNLALDSKLRQPPAADMTKLEVDDFVQHLTESLSKAAEETVPSIIHRIGSKKPWSADIKKAFISNKEALRTWNSVGRPDSAHPVSTARRAARKLLRRAFRIQTAKIRNNLYHKIIDSHSNKNKLFYKLVARQRSNGPSSSSALRIDGRTITDPDELGETWADYFCKLGTPSEDPTFYAPYKERVADDLKAIKTILKSQGSKPAPVTIPEVIKAIKKLNGGKAPDPLSLRAEHFLKAACTIAPHLCTLFTAILNTCHIPEKLQVGTMIPIPKKGKDHTQPANYRGITLTPMFTKVLEHVLLGREEHHIDRAQHQLQIGFTPERSPSWGALMLTEAISEGKDMKIPVYTAALDVQKAFDTVFQDSLLRKLYLAGVQDSWPVRENMIRNLSIRVRVGDTLSRPVPVRQGVGQGRPWSTHDYKLMVNDVLETLTSSGVGFNIGPYNCPAPTCADDIVLMSKSAEGLQALLDIVIDYSTTERYTIHPTKSMVVLFNHKKHREEQHSWSLGVSSVPVEKMYRHLGVDRFSEDIGSAQLIKGRISSARRASYALMGTGFHGNNGSSFQVIREIYLLYIVPLCTYGLDSIVLKKSHLTALEQYHRKTLRHLMSLPERTATEAVHLLAGIPPITAFIHQKALGLLGAITRTPESLLHQIGLRQLAVKDTNSSSWFVFMYQVTEKYDLPSPHELFESPVPKSKWKTMVKNHVYQHYDTTISQGARTKSTLKYLDIKSLTTTKMADSLCSVNTTDTETARSRVHIKLLTGTYILQSHRARFNQNAVDPTCQLCGQGSETTDHFIATCPALEPVRRRYLDDVVSATPELSTSIAGNPQNLTLLVLNPSMFCPENVQCLSADRLELLSFISRKYVFNLHTWRNKALLPGRDRLLLKGGTRR